MIKVSLRSKKISKGRRSLYLDFYPPIENPTTRKPTRRQFLKLYIIEKPKTLMDKQYNKEKLIIANSIRQRRENQLNKPEIYSDFEREQIRRKEIGNQSFLTYFLEQSDKKYGSNRNIWLSAYSYLKQFAGRDLKFNQLNEGYFENFKTFLLSAKSRRSTKRIIARNTAVSYFNKVKATLKQAYKDGYIQENLHAKIRAIEPEDTTREYLTLEELNRLVETDCKVPILKRAALFSALTGLRFSDIQKLKWQEIMYIQGDGYTLKFKQKKTKRIEHHPIGKQAYFLTDGDKNPKRMPGSHFVFKGLKYSAYQNKHLADWVKKAGIERKITFHCFRHTYATLHLTKGTDLYTISKLLGHKNIKTTQVYAKIVNEEKRQASEKIKLNF
ncbi:site-specific integrase [Christiangramia salexigens]|uniref:Integrase n=1 Tax=Christiangramia salexigens TaxID=1913577 RepID=A0A1L3J2J5_9FLAO|nr:site-specific integrase [Christiangramia salexigens]APG59345.1 integrase [Christiangramia salexigens]